MTTQERSLIDRYIDNSLSGVELKEFMDKLESDESFRKSVSFHNLLIESIQVAEDGRVEKAIIEKIGYKKPLIPTGLKLILTFLFITGVGIILWQYIGTGSLQSRRKIFNLDLFRKSADRQEKEKLIDKPIVSTKEKQQEGKVDTVESSGMETAVVEGQPVTQDSSDVSNRSEDENLIVKKDQLLVTHTLKVTGLQTEDIKKTGEGSLSQSTASKLNPVAGLVENSNIEDDNYEVEFWLSPVNYRGYKLNSNKLILFGIEEPDAVKLYYFEHKLMMKYGQEYFRLNPSEEFLSFSMIKNTDLPAALK
ncbi:MAG: hypothetical protein KA285_01925 [Bacteroidia bacterium]|nr:hypothetical protein [Bacteroidia bacterium]